MLNTTYSVLCALHPRFNFELFFFGIFNTTGTFICFRLYNMVL